MLRPHPWDPNRFFYFESVHEKDYLYIETMNVLHTDRSEDNFRPPNKAWYLQRFKDDGFYLIDVFDTPIDGEIRNRIRKEWVLANQEEVLRKMERLKPSITDETRIILIKASVYELDLILRSAGYNVANTNMIPFPSTGHQMEYREEMTQVLEPYFRERGQSPLATTTSTDDTSAENDDESDPIYSETLLLDEYCSTFGAYLSDCGWTVKTVHDFGLDGNDLNGIVMFAKRYNLLIVTRDERLEYMTEHVGARCIPIKLALFSGIYEYISEEKDPNPERDFIMHASDGLSHCPRSVARCSLCVRPHQYHQATQN